MYGNELIRYLGRYVDGEYFGLFDGQFENPTVKGIITGPTCRNSSGVIGLSEAFRVLPEFLNTLSRVKKFVEKEKPEAVILIDYPEFNLRLAEYAKRQGSRVFYLAPPQVWAWREWRIKTLRRYVDEAIVFLPFEESYYRRKGINAYFLGHPLIDLLSSTGSLETPGPESESLKIAILPGSRPSEWRHHFDVVAGVMARILSEFPGAWFILPLPPGTAPVLEGFLEKGFRRHPQVFEKVRVVRNGRYDALRGCEVGIVASGTATLEMALLGIPMVVFYRVDPLSAMVGRLFIKAPFASLPNLIIKRYLVPELLQDSATTEVIFRFARLLISSSELKLLQKRGFDIIRKSLGQAGVWQRIAQHLSTSIGKY